MEILGLIPARSGSKSIQHKNIKLLKGRPLLSYSIQQSLASSFITRTIVSTDSQEYADLSKEWGAETPFLRPEKISGDQATDLEAFQHALRWLDEHEGYRPEIVVHLRPTHPNRKVSDIDRVLEILISNPMYSSVRSISLAPETPYKMWFRHKDGILANIVSQGPAEAHSMPRQSLPITYLQNASIDAIRTRVIMEENSMVGSQVFGYVMEDNFDIDLEEDFDRSDANMVHALFMDNETKTFCFDIDGVIATITPENDYTKCEPLKENIELINRLYDKGHTIILNTARGYVTKIDWKETTEQQMIKWGLKYHQLMLTKPAADFYIDDKSIGLELLHKHFNTTEQ
ncbi:MAG: acylneuraminate cytidylyltransferase [Cyclobacteriaceae bacterium]|nr:acylneuraminate cytidylyltransferase [Cyclobacteriaceae bacterium]